MRTLHALFVLLSGCNIALEPPVLAESLRDNDFRSLNAEPDMVVMSPFSPRMTAALIDQVRQTREAVEVLMDARLPKELVVTFRSVEDPDAEWIEEVDGTWTLKGVGRASAHGVVGYHTGTTDMPTVALFVPAPAKATRRWGQVDRIEFTFGLDSTIRHEFAHACAKQAGLDGDTWFDEGLAEEIEHRTLNEVGRLVPARSDDSLRIAKRHHAKYTIDDVLDWEENGWNIAQGDEEAFRHGRPLSHSLIRYLLGRTPGASLQEKFHRILALDKETIRAMEPEWKAWLDAL
jgi:hypothetical protein